MTFKGSRCLHRRYRFKSINPNFRFQVGLSFFFSQYPPASYIWKSGNEYKVKGEMIDIWRKLERLSNFRCGCYNRNLATLSNSVLSTSFVPGVDGKWGSKTSNGSFNGIIGMLQRKEVDVGTMPFGAFSFRSKVADHTQPLYYFSYES